MASGLGGFDDVGWERDVELCGGVAIDDDLLPGNFLEGNRGWIFALEDARREVLHDHT